MFQTSKRFTFYTTYHFSVLYAGYKNCILIRKPAGKRRPAVASPDEE